MAGFVLWPLLAVSSIAVLSILGWRKSWPLDLVVCTVSLVVANALLLSIFGALSATGWAIALVLELVLAVALIWRLRGAGAFRLPRERLAAWRAGAQALRPKSARAAVELALTAAAVIAMSWAVVTFFNEALFQMQWAPVNKDSLSYHIPRAYFWLQEGRVGPLPVTDFRWNEFPPNSSILIAWTMAAGGFPLWTAIPQHVGVLLLCCSAWLLVRRLDGSPFAAAIAVLCLFSFPSLYLQARTASNDVLVAGLVLASACYLVTLIEDLVRTGRVHWASVVFFAACVGLGCGVKLTYGLIAPAAIVGAGVALWIARGELKGQWRRLAMQAAAIALVIVALGAWGYLQNLFTFGHPFVSAQTAALRSAQFSNPEPLSVALLLSAYQTASLHGLETAFPALLDTRYNLFSAFAALFGMDFASFTPIAENSGLRAPSYQFASAGHGLIGALAGLAAIIGAPAFAIAAILRRSWRDAVLAFLAVACVTAMLFFCLAKDWTPSHPRYLLSFLPLGLVVLMCAIDRLRGVKYVLLAPLAVYSIWIAMWMTDASPWRREITGLTAQGFHHIDLAQNGDLGVAMRALARGAPAGAPIEIFGKADAWVYAAVTVAPGPRYSLGRSASPPADVRWALIEQHGVRNTRAFPLPRWVEPPRIWLIADDLPAFVRANTDLYEMAREADGDWVMSARALSTLSGAPYGATRELNMLRFTVPTFLLGSGPQRFSFKLRARTPIQDLIRRAVCDGAEAPYSLSDAGETGTLVAVTIATPAPPDRPTNCTLMLAGPHEVSTNPQRGADLTVVAPARLEAVR
jgi:4-amino-4-deoxy-L-arabinose transferase-like glycosyltransferase